MVHETMLSPQSRLFLIHSNRLISFSIKTKILPQQNTGNYTVMCYEPGKKNSKSFRTPKHNESDAKLPAYCCSLLRTKKKHPPDTVMKTPWEQCRFVCTYSYFPFLSTQGTRLLFQYSIFSSSQNKIPTDQYFSTSKTQSRLRVMS